MKNVEEKLLKYEFSESLSNEILNEIIREFDKKYDSLQTKSLGEKASKNSFKDSSTGETTMIGKNYFTDEIGLIKYPQNNSYLISKGNSSRKIIENVLISNKIRKYKTSLVNS